MYHGYLPLLTKGSFALFLGGSDILPQLSEKSGSFVTPSFMLFSLVFQLSFLIFKKVKLGQQPHSSSLSILSNTILSGFSNTYNLVAIVVFTLCGCLYFFIHHLYLEKNRNSSGIWTELTETVDLRNVPSSIYLFCGILLAINISLFKQNIALRIVFISEVIFHN